MTTRPVFLLTNDDGPGTPGLLALRRAASSLGRVVTIVPTEVCSGCGHTTHVNQTLRYHELGDDLWTVDGHTADCVRAGLLHFIPEATHIISGVNHGGNLGIDVPMSGTAAGAREGAYFGRWSAAFSQVLHPDAPVDWNWVADQARRVLERLLAQTNGPGFWNVNFPAKRVSDQPEIVPTQAETGHLVFDTHHDPKERTLKIGSRYHERNRQPDSDVGHCFDGRVAICWHDLSTEKPRWASL